MADSPSLIFNAIAEKNIATKSISPLQRTSNFFLLFFLFQPVLLQLERGEKK
jgi:hypothetical protein